MKRSVDFAKLLEKVPEGHWAAIAPDYSKVVASGTDCGELRKQAPDAAIIKKCSDVVYGGFRLPVRP